MNQSTLIFETKPLKDCVSLTKSMDRACFPAEMWLGNEDMSDLLQREAETIIMLEHGRVIGQAILLPETAAFEILEDVDPNFTVRTDGIYSYSVGIIPDRQKQGFGTRLLREVADQMRQRGFRALSAHVRVRHGWNDVRMEALHIVCVRTVPDFWEDAAEVVQYQDARL